MMGSMRYRRIGRELWALDETEEKENIVFALNLAKEVLNRRLVSLLLKV